MNIDISELDRRAVDWTVEIASAITTDDLDLPTPCDGWTLRDLLDHTLSQNAGFAAAAHGNGANLSIWESGKVGNAPAAEYRASAELINSVFTEDGVSDRAFFLPEIRDGGPFPASMAIGFHFVDNIVHGWDIGKTIGTFVEPDADLITHALQVAERIPNTPDSRGPGQAFALSLHEDVTDDVTDYDRLLLMLGRSPRWTPG